MHIGVSNTNKYIPFCEDEILIDNEIVGDAKKKENELFLIKVRCGQLVWKSCVSFG